MKKPTESTLCDVVTLTKVVFHVEDYMTHEMSYFSPPQVFNQYSTEEDLSLIRSSFWSP